MAVDDQYTVSLLHFDGELTDESGKVWIANSGAATSNIQSKFGGSSLYLDVGSKTLTTANSTDFNFGVGDFTIDWWEYRTATATTSGDGIFTIAVSNRASLFLGSNSTNNNAWIAFSGDSSWDVILFMGATVYNAWTHYALVRKSGVFYTFQNGNLVTSNSSKANAMYYASNYQQIIGGTNAKFIDEFRVSKGIARWISNFTPPAAPYSSGVPVNPPTNLTAIAGDSQVTLSWDAVEEATGYNVKRSTTAGGPYTTIGSNVSGTSYVDSAVINGTTYYYVVTAITANGESGPSNETSATPTAPPDPKLHIVLEAGEQIQLIGNILPEIIGDPNLEWNSAFPNIASVDTTGKVTAHAEGVTRIQVKTVDGTWTDYALVEVIAKEYRLSILLKVGDSCLLKFAADKDVIWQSGDSAVATFAPSNAPITKVTARAEGLSLITVNTADGSKGDQIYVTVIK